MYVYLTRCEMCRWSRCWCARSRVCFGRWWSTWTRWRSRFWRVWPGPATPRFGRASAGPKTTSPPASRSIKHMTFLSLCALVSVIRLVNLSFWAWMKPEFEPSLCLWSFSLWVFVVWLFSGDASSVSGTKRWEQHRQRSPHSHQPRTWPQHQQHGQRCVWNWTHS